MQKALSFLLGVIAIFIFPNLVLAGAPVQNNSSYVTPSGPAASDGTSTETVTVHLQDSDQNNVVGSVVTLSSSNDSTATFPKNNQTTDSSGNASFTVATTTPGTVKITLLDSTNNVTFTDWFSLTFYDSTKGCINVPAAPVLSSVTSNSDNKVTIVWKNSADPVSNYLVSYGVETAKYIYGAPNIGAQGTTSYTVDGLTGNKKYYFVVAATNNCGRSGFSNEISVIVKPIPSTPIPTTRPTSSPAVITQTPTPVSNNVVVSLDTPEPLATMEATVSETDNKTKIRNLGIGIMATGFIIVVLTFVIIMFKEKNKITLITENLTNPNEVILPKTDNNIPPQQPY